MIQAIVGCGEQHGRSPELIQMHIKGHHPGFPGEHDVT